MKAWALFLMLLLSCLSPRAEEAGQAAASATSEVVALPPLLVEESREDQHWLYATCDQVEALSLCPSGFTKDFVQQMALLERLLTLVLPRELQWNRSKPLRLLLYSKSGKDGLSNRFVSSQSRVPMMPNLRIDDFDGSVMCTIVNTELIGDNLALRYERGYVTTQMLRRMPTLPQWYVEGVLQLFSSLHFSKEFGFFQAHMHGSLDPMKWTHKEARRTIGSVVDWPRQLIPIKELLEAADWPVDESPDSQKFRSLIGIQSALLVRWGLEDQPTTRRERFTYYVARASAEPRNEALLRECLGLTYAQLRDELSDYLPRAVTKELELPVGSLGEFGEASVRPAAPNEIYRIKGEWERLACRKVKAEASEQVKSHVELYLKQARRTFSQATALEKKDGLLLQSAGLFELEFGDEDIGRGLLEEALVAGPSLAPRAAFELAQLRLISARRAAGEGVPIGRVEAGRIRVLLRMADGQEPALPEVYALWAQLCLYEGKAAAGEDLAVLEQALARFPRLRALAVLIEQAKTGVP
jgi:hypothetical protein